MAENQILKRCSLTDNPFDVLPQEILLDILLQLPNKDLVSYACTCKYLLSFLTGPFFTAFLAKRNYKNPFIFFRYYLKKKFKQYYSLQPDDDSFNMGKNEVAMPIDCFYGRCFNVVSIYNGLICLSDDLYSSSNVIILWNPSIRKSLELPESSFKMENYFDIAVGFGFDARLYDYKVVRLAYEYKPLGNLAPPRVEVYSLRRGSWKEITTPGPSCDICNRALSCPSYSHCYIRRACHWPGYRDDFWSAIVTFNMTDEVFGEIKLPPSLEGVDRHNMELKVSDLGMRNVLVLIQMQRFVGKDDERVPINYSSIWIMRQYGVVDSWTRIFAYPIQNEYPTPRAYFFRMNQDLLVLMGNSDLQTEEKHTLYYRKGSVSKDLGQVKGKPFGFYLNLYNESLALLKEGKAVPVSALEENDKSVKGITEYKGSGDEESDWEDMEDDENGEIIYVGESEGEDDEEAQNEGEDNQEAQNQGEDNQEAQNQGEDNE